MNVEVSSTNDYHTWLLLAKEVEPLFGPMINKKGFQDALKEALKNKHAYCIYPEEHTDSNSIAGGIIISKTLNEILWFAVSNAYRRKGYGRKLLATALLNLDKNRVITVQTFDKSTTVGAPARKLYQDFGFIDSQISDINPAGIPTIIMCKNCP